MKVLYTGPDDFGIIRINLQTNFETQCFVHMSFKMHPSNYVEIHSYRSKESKKSRAKMARFYYKNVWRATNVYNIFKSVSL